MTKSDKIEAAPKTLSWEQIKRDNAHMDACSVRYEGNHAIVGGNSAKYGQCRADYYFQDGVWVLGAN